MKKNVNNDEILWQYVIYYDEEMMRYEDWQ